MHNRATAAARWFALATQPTHIEFVGGSRRLTGLAHISLPVLAVRGLAAVQALHNQVRRLVHQQDDFGVFARRLADAYALVLSFNGRFSELKVNGIVRSASSRLEHLLAKIPPIEPPPDPARRGRVIALRKP